MTFSDDASDLPLSQDSLEAQWSARDISMMNVTEVFARKPGILKKAEAQLTRLKESIEIVLPDYASALPAEANIQKWQIARGENHKNFPFISLDIPQYFSKTEMFAFRTLFWWGHYLGFALILKGEKLPGYIKRLTELKNGDEWKDVYFSSAQTPWEWGLESCQNAQETSNDSIEDIVSNIQYLKLCRVFPLDAPEFNQLDWAKEGATSFKIMAEVAR
ncbi:MAG: hypothetical protein G3M78_11875 [Candidatus Nitrohelix vancouverensis]|uniref:Uncharacterized protein n=1 Tax=Candidatus Nitrohelix vancouverensis TaxID=2705534 RepID=A0A7T0C3T6_9BACT|nr:MAG: hypothetical protein G3M78_11875 [Candidatus Nitrohelix vancouverensis]